ncbi:MAG: hypothetical protein LBD24_02415 [Spirochaetaceae bacterium]|jgi:hypothetical protein|nr:hypothetical protein [Spirochaetaceae bacterium]
MKIMRPERKPILVILVKRTVTLFLGLCLMVIFLYCLGTAQGFMDRTQLRLLRLGEGMGLFLWVSAGYGVALDCYLIYRGRIRYVRSLVSYVFIGVFGIAVALFAAFIVVLTRGAGSVEP